MSVVLGAIGIYLLLGLLFAVWFVAHGVGRVDPVASGAGVGFRVLIVPGCAALWPVLLVKWVRAKPYPRPSQPRPSQPGPDQSGPDQPGAHA